MNKNEFSKNNTEKLNSMSGKREYDFTFLVL